MSVYPDYGFVRFSSTLFEPKPEGHVGVGTENMTSGCAITILSTVSASSQVPMGYVHKAPTLLCPPDRQTNIVSRQETVLQREVKDALEEIKRDDYGDNSGVRLSRSKSWLLGKNWNQEVRCWLGASMLVHLYGHNICQVA